MLNAIVIDDEESVYKVIRKVVEIEEIPMNIVDYARDGQEGYDLLASGAYDLVFIDIVMPYYSGLELMEEFPDNNYIVVTAYSDFKYAQQALRLGAKDILLKPVNRKALKESYSRVFDITVTGNEVVDEILEYLKLNYMEDITVKELATKHYFQESNLSRLFKKHTDSTIIETLNQIRIEEAKNLLLNTSQSIDEISYNVGYKNKNYFHRQFKLRVGETPNQYRMKEA